MTKYRIQTWDSRSSIMAACGGYPLGTVTTLAEREVCVRAAGCHSFTSCLRFSYFPFDFQILPSNSLFCSVLLLIFHPLIITHVVSSLISSYSIILFSLSYPYFLSLVFHFLFFFSCSTFLLLCQCPFFPFFVVSSIYLSSPLHFFLPLTALHVRIVRPTLILLRLSPFYC